MPGMLQPVLETPRLILRPFTMADVSDVTRLAGDPLVAATTANIPHPYTERDAETWIGTHAEGFETGKLLDAAVTDSDDGTLFGAVGVQIRPTHDRAELGYWTGVPYWGRGYATEASRALLAWAFGERRLHRVLARHFARNRASGRVLEKLGMRQEGVLREHSHFDDGFGG